MILNPDGTISEGPGGCLVLMRDDVFLTPGVNSGILESITRKTILELGAEIGVEMAERPIGRTEMYMAEEAFYCGTGQEIGPVTAFDGRPVGSGNPGPVTRRLQAEFDGIVQATPVGSPEVPGNFFGNGRLPKRGSVILDLGR